MRLAKIGKMKPQRRQIGVKLDTELWKEMKILALRTGKTAGELLEDAIREYMAKRGTNSPAAGTSQPR